MRFDEITLYDAIYSVKHDVDGLKSDPVTTEHREAVARHIQAYLPIGSAFSIDQMMQAWVLFRKAADEKMSLVIEVARSHGTHCFWHNRVVGECSPIVSLDRLWPGSCGGPYTLANCVLSCSTHNSRRGDLPVEEFIRRNS